MYGVSQLYVTELGRVASHFYIRYASILVFNEQLTKTMDEARVRIKTLLSYY